MAFEQAAGRKDLDGRVDEYALGVILYQMITGTRPYENDDTGHAFAKVLAGIPYRKPRELNPEVPPRLEQAVLRAMARDRDQRFSTLREFLTAVAQSTGFELLHPPAPGDNSGTAKVAVVTARIAPRSRVGEILAIAGVAFVGLVIAAVFAFRFGMSSAQKPTSAVQPPPPVTTTAPIATPKTTTTATTPPTTPALDIGDLPSAPTVSATASAPPVTTTTAQATTTQTSTHSTSTPKCIPKPGVPCL